MVQLVQHVLSAPVCVCVRGDMHLCNPAVCMSVLLYQGMCWQVIVDVPRTAPGVPFFAQAQLQKSLERILYLWGIRCCTAA